MEIYETTHDSVVEWLLQADEPWTRYRLYRDLFDLKEDNDQVARARTEMVNHPQVRDLVQTAVSWPGYALKRHNDAKHPLYAFSTLADFGLRYDDPGMSQAIDKILEKQSLQGPFQTQIRLYKQFGGLDGEYWTWMACDAPTLTYSLFAMGLDDDPRVKLAVDHLAEQAHNNGWRCSAAPELGSFKGPGGRLDPCPIANLLALKVFALLPHLQNSEPARLGVETLLKHYNREFEKKLFLFGTGSKFHKLKYPFVWYDILHVCEVLSRFPFIYDDLRFQQMVNAISQQADEDGRFTATSMYRAWKGWSFADKKRPSPWLTFIVLRILRRTKSDV